jgi:hypothetical protein
MLMTIPALGHVVALTWLLEVGEVERFHSAKQVISYCGLSSHNPAFPASAGAVLAVSLRHTQKAVNVRQTLMNAAFLCRIVSLCICPYSFALGNVMKEVTGSIPVRSTNQPFRLNSLATSCDSLQTPRGGAAVSRVEKA